MTTPLAIVREVREEHVDMDLMHQLYETRYGAFLEGSRYPFIISDDADVLRKKVRDCGLFPVLVH